LNQIRSPSFWLFQFNSGWTSCQLILLVAKPPAALLALCPEPLQAHVLYCVD
jgi:hypothetical protein